MKTDLQEDDYTHIAQFQNKDKKIDIQEEHNTKRDSFQIASPKNEVIKMKEIDLVEKNFGQMAKKRYSAAFKRSVKSLMK